MSDDAYQLTITLVCQGTRTGWRLNDGLGLAFTPATENDGIARFVASRQGMSPAEAEIQACAAGLLDGLERVGIYRPYGRPIPHRLEQDTAVWEWRIERIEL